MGLFSAIFGTQEERNLRICLKIYNKAKKARPGKDERDYLKLVLITKPPFDYQYDNVLERMLDESNNDIRELAKWIHTLGNPKSRLSSSHWEARQRNIKLNLHEFEDRNQQFFRDFWDS